MKKIPFVIVLLIVAGSILAMTKFSGPEEAAEAIDGEEAAEYTGDTESSDAEEYVFTPHQDTLYMIGGKALGYGFYSGDGYGLLYDLKPFLSSDVIVDSVSSTTFALDLVGRRKVFDTNSPTCIRDMQAFVQPLPGFGRFEKEYTKGIAPNCTLRYDFTLDYPDTSMLRRDEIMRWVVGLVENSEAVRVCSDYYSMKGDHHVPAGYHVTDFGGTRADADKIGRFEADAFFRSVDIDQDLVNDTNNLFLDVFCYAYYESRVCNDRYVTYFEYRHCHESIGHGYYCNYLHSYDLVNGKPVDYGYLFKPGTEDTIRALVIQAMASDPRYRESSNTNSPEEVAERLKYWANDITIGYGNDTKLRITSPALSDDGVVFTFQPYEIDCFAGGTWHFTIPYKKAKPYMTQRAIDLLGL